MLVSVYITMLPGVTEEEVHDGPTYPPNKIPKRICWEMSVFRSEYFTSWQIKSVNNKMEVLHCTLFFES